MDSLEIKAGKKVTLNNANIYPTPKSVKSAGTKTGVFFLWSDDLINGKVRITTSPENINKPGCITGWVNVVDLNKTITITEVPRKGGFVLGQAVILKDVKFYPNSAINKESTVRSGTYYIWSKDIVNDRIRITNDPTKAGKTGYITAWVNIHDI